MASANPGAGAEASSFPIHFGGPFSLIDHAGTARTEKDFRGRFMLVYFGYTHCPDICPTNLQTMADALDRLGDAARHIQPLFITVDPTRDTTALLGDYVRNFHPRLIGLTGSEPAVGAAVRAYKVHRRKVALPDAEGVDDYLVNHAPNTYLMGPDGAFITLFPHGTKVDFMATAIRKYLP